MKAKTILNAVFMTAGNIVWVAVAYNAVVLSKPHLFNIYKFFAWASFALLFIPMLGKMFNVKGCSKPRPAYYRYCGAIADFSIAVMMAAFGHFGYASLQTVQIVMEAFVFAPKSEL